MDDLLPLLLIGAMYLAPILWRKFVSKKYTQIHLPKQVIIPKVETVPEEDIALSLKPIVDLQVPIVTNHAQSIPIVEAEASAWQGKLTEGTVMNGLIFAEILQPPRAYRPFRKQK